MTKSFRWMVVPASGILLAGCGVQPHRSASPAPAPHSHLPTIPNRPSQSATRPPAGQKSPSKPKTTSLQAPKVGTTTVTKTTTGHTTTITKTTVVGSTSTTILQSTHSDALPVISYTIGQTFASTGATALAAFDALWTVRHRNPPRLPVPMEVITVPWKPATQWAIVPEAIADPAQSGAIFWAGIRTGSRQWTWIPSDTANAPNPHLPLVLRDTLYWAQDLALNAPGPSAPLGGNIPWANVTGTVKMPAGWSWVAYGGSINAWAWDPSVKQTSVYYAPWTIWNRSNATTGYRALDQILASGKPLAQTVAVSAPAGS